MEQLSWDGLLKGLVILVAFAAALIVLGSAINMIRGWRKPKTDAEKDIQNVLAAYKHRLDAHEEQICETRAMNRAICTALNAILMHEITGSGEDKLCAAKGDLDKYLISLGEK